MFARSATMVKVLLDDKVVMDKPYAKFGTFKDFRFWFIREVLLRDVPDVVDHVFIEGVDTMEQGPRGINFVAPVPSGCKTPCTIRFRDKVYDVVIDQ